MSNELKNLRGPAVPHEASMKTHSKTFAIALLWFLAAWASPLRAADLIYTSPEQAGLARGHLNRVDAQLMKYVQSNRISGTVALIARRGQIGYLKAFGLRDIEANLPMETNTLFRIASMTKLVTSIGLMTLVDKGMVGLDDPVAKFIPEFASPTIITQGDPNRRTRPSTNEITIRHLLTHTSGIIYRFSELVPLSRM
jgi:CubicO group peptidase (beta-lactamase class C family)